MSVPLIFGSPEPDIQHAERRAAYVVIIRDGQVALVKSHENYFLPGGGSLMNESPAETVVREAHEELGRGMRVIRPLGEAIQYFYSNDDRLHYEMRASFFAGELTDESRVCAGEHELHWLPRAQAAEACFHECHAWAISQA